MDLINVIKTIETKIECFKKEKQNKICQIKK